MVLFQNYIKVKATFQNKFEMQRKFQKVVLFSCLRLIASVHGSQ